MKGRKVTISYTNRCAGCCCLGVSGNGGNARWEGNEREFGVLLLLIIKRVASSLFGIPCTLLSIVATYRMCGEEYDEVKFEPFVQHSSCSLSESLFSSFWPSLGRTSQPSLAFKHMTMSDSSSHVMSRRHSRAECEPVEKLPMTYM